MKLFIILLLSALCAYDCAAQTDTLQTTALNDSAVTGPTLTLGVLYAANADYYGQKGADKIPYVAAAATYRFRSGLYLSGLAYRLLNDTGSFISASSIGAGYEFKISKRFAGELSYSHTFYPALSPFLQASNPDNVSASITYDNWLSTKLNMDYAFGKTNDQFVTLGTSKQVTVGHITSKDQFVISPLFEVTAGTQHFYQTYAAEKRLRDSLLGVVLTPVTGTPPGPGSPKTIVTTEFNLLSYNFKLPLSFYRASYMFQLTYQLSVLSHKAQSGAGHANSFVNAAFYYQF